MLQGDPPSTLWDESDCFSCAYSTHWGTFCILVSWKRPTGFSFFAFHFGLFFGVFDLASLVDNADAFGTKCLGASPKFVRGAYLRHTGHGSPCFVER
jgi:hypothetical protein